MNWVRGGRKINRRTFISSTLAASGHYLYGQQSGVASRGLQAQRKAPPSGRPFSSFIDVAEQAGPVTLDARSLRGVHLVVLAITEELARTGWQAAS